MDKLGIVDFLNKNAAENVVAYINNNREQFIDDFDNWFDLLGDAYWEDFSSKPEYAKIVEVFNLLAGKVAYKNNFKYKPDNKLKQLNLELEQLKKMYKNNPPKTKQKAEKISDAATKILNEVRWYFQEVVPYKEVYKKIFLTEQIISPRQQLKQQMDEHDKDYPLNKKYIVSQYDEDGFEIEGSARLETDEEMQTRINNELARRKVLLEQESEENVQQKLMGNLQNFINQVVEITKINIEAGEILSVAATFLREEKLKEFTNDTEFYQELLEVMQHNKNECSYLYHGTQSVEAAISISEVGLAMREEELSSTTYKEFTPEQLLLYSRGFMGEIGSDAVVIIKQPKIRPGQTDAKRDKESPKYERIVEKMGKRKVPFMRSGLAGLDGEPRYIVPAENVVAVVDKRNRKIIYGMAYQNKKETTV